MGLVMPQDQGDLARDPLIRAFGAVLRRYREAAGLSRPQLAEALGCGYQWIEKMETGKKPSIDSAIDLDTYFKIPEKTFQTMAEEIERAGKHVTLPPGFPRYAELEAQSRSIRKFEALSVTGLLQTEDYARELLRSGQPIEDQLEQLVAHRMKRQQKIFAQTTPPRLWVVLDETALRRPIASPEIMRAQHAHLIEIGERPNVFLQVVPYSTGGYGGLEGSFTVLTLDRLAKVAYFESAGHGHVVEDVDAVASYAERFELIRADALPVDESRKLIIAIMEAT